MLITETKKQKQKSNNNNNKKQVLKGQYETWRVIVNPMIHPKFKKGLKNQYLRDTEIIFETSELYDITQEDHVKWEKIAVPLENSSRRDEYRRKIKRRQKHNGKIRHNCVWEVKKELYRKEKWSTTSNSAGRRNRLRAEKRLKSLVITWLLTFLRAISVDWWGWNPDCSGLTVTERRGNGSSAYDLLFPKVIYKLEYISV